MDTPEEALIGSGDVKHIGMIWGGHYKVFLP